MDMHLKKFQEIVKDREASLKCLSFIHSESTHFNPTVDILGPPLLCNLVYVLLSHKIKVFRK